MVGGKAPDLTTWDLGVIASILKLFLYYLPEPLLATESGYTDLTEAASMLHCKCLE